MTMTMALKRRENRIRRQASRRGLRVRQNTRRPQLGRYGRIRRHGGGEGDARDPPRRIPI